MTPETTIANVRQAVPFFRVSSIEASVRFYVDGLGFEMTRRWLDGGTLRWCWLRLGEAAVMLQEFPREGHDSWAPDALVGVGVSIYFICEDACAIYRDVRARGVDASRPVVANGMWVTSLSDPDCYHLLFESATNAPEGSELAESIG